MDCEKARQMIRTLRLEKQITQKSLAGCLHLSDRTISKWERGLGYPDVALLPALSEVLGADIGRILKGDLSVNAADGGNMKRVRFYRCPICGNILTMTGAAEISCCGRKLTAMTARPADSEHQIKIERLEDEYYITFLHPMHKTHYISFVTCVSWDRMLFLRLYPEQGGELRLPRLAGRPDFYAGCSRHGLWKISE